MGAALLDDPSALGNLILKLTKGSNGVPVSVKIRLGKDKSHINVIDTAKAAEDSGASLIFIHARTRADRYHNDADWNWLRKVKESVSIPVVGNGSMFTPQDIKNMIDQTGCDSAMIARGALGNPFIFSRFNKLIETGNDPGEPDVYTIRDTLLQHIANLENEFGELLALDKAKKHSIWYFRYKPGMNTLLNSVFKIKSLDLLRSLIHEHCEKIANGSAETNEGLQIDEKFQRKVLFWLEDDIQELG